MKKRILLSSSFLLMLAACSNEESGQIAKQTDKVTQVKDVELQETEEKIQKELDQKKKDAYAAHYSALSTLINDNGIVPENHELGSWIMDEDNSGVLYAELLDFNNDHIEELLIVNLNDTNDYTLQVFSYINGESKLIHEEEFSEASRADQTTISLVEDDKGNIHIKHDEWANVKPDNIQGFEVSSLIDTNFDLTKYFGDDEKNTYTINDKSIDAETFSKEIQKYKNERFIVNNLNGEKFFEIDTTNPTQLVNNLLNHLKAHQNSIANKTNEISRIDDSDLLAIKKILTNTWYMSNLTIDNKVELIQNAYGSSLIEGIEFGEDEDSSYAIINENNLNEQLMRYFGTTVSHDQVEERPTDFNEYVNVFYENGNYYILDIGYSGLMDLPIRDITKVIEITKDQYYIEFTNYSFNYYEYGEDIQAFKDLPLAQWPDSARPFVNEGLFNRMSTGFSIVTKNNDGTYCIRYLSETNGLTDEDIKNL